MYKRRSLCNIKIICKDFTIKSKLIIILFDQEITVLQLQLQSILSIFYFLFDLKSITLIHGT